MTSSENTWIDRHSVQCGGCGGLIDERKAVRNLFGGNVEFGAGCLCAACGRAVERAPEIAQLVAELVEWSDRMGGWEAPVWSNLAALHAEIR